MLRLDIGFLIAALSWHLSMDIRLLTATLPQPCHGTSWSLYAHGNRLHWPVLQEP